MTGRIPDSFIEQLLERTDIVALIGGYVPLRKTGRDSVGLCPFHKEKSPSFTVSPAKQFYYCFGCGAAGTAIGFLMKHAGMQFPDAVEELAHRAGMEVPREGGAGHGGGRLEEIYALLQRAAEYYRRQLQGEPGAKARDYLRRRQIGEQTAEAYGLGYAAPGWDGLLRELGGDGAARRLLVEAGLVAAKDNGARMYDRFRDRIVFPVYGRRRDRPVGFGARTIGTDEPKYLNSPETAVFRKGRELYGAHLPLHKQGPLERLYVVEGYLDVISLAERGIANAVAALGTALTRAQLEAAFRLCPQLVLCFDGDAAGRNAAGRALETALPLLRPGMELRFLLLPEGEDPDTFVRRVGAERFAEPSRTVPLSDFLIGRAREGLALDSREGRARLLDRAAKQLHRMGDPFLHRLILQDLAPLVGMDADFLEVQLRVRQEAPPRKKAAQSPEAASLVGNIVSLLLQRPALALRIAQPESLRRLEVPGADFLADLVQWICDHPEAACAGILEHWRGSRYEKRLQELAVALPPIDEEAVLEQALQGALARLRQRHDRRRLRALIARGPERLGPEDREELQALQQSCGGAPQAGNS